MSQPPRDANTFKEESRICANLPHFSGGKPVDRIQFVLFVFDFAVSCGYLYPCTGR